jgi:short-subunit dehydrogenase
MRILAGQTVLLTGASGGLGTYMAQAFAARKVKLALVAHPGIDLEGLRKSLADVGAQAVAITSDLRDPVQRREMLAAVRLERRQGHIVNISSLAGKSGPAFQEPYAATKAGLVALTQSLRATYRGTGVSASVIVPAFVEAGIYARLKAKSGCAAPALLTGCSPEQVAQAVLRSIEGDVPEIIVSRYPIRPVLALSVLSPRLGGWITARMGVNDFFRRAAEAEKRNRS